jgi:hypothetical protein
MLILPPEKLYDLQYFDRPVIIDCARDYRAYDLDRPSDCSEFSSGSLAELCAVDPEQFKKSNKSDCSVFITPGQINHEQTPLH